MYLHHILNFFGVTKNSPYGVYCPVKENNNLYVVSERDDLYSSIVLSKLIVKISEYIYNYKSDRISVVYTADRLTISPIRGGGTRIHIHNHDDTHDPWATGLWTRSQHYLQLEIYNTNHPYATRNINKIYLSYQRCLEYCLFRNLSNLHGTTPPIKQWIRAAKTTITKNTKIAKQLQFYISKYNK